MRAMFAEQYLSYMLRENTSWRNAVVVVRSFDVLLNKAIMQQDILDAHCNNRTIFMTGNNNGPDGYTDGFYVGHISAIVDALSSYDVLDRHLKRNTTEHPYETLLKMTFSLFGLEHQYLRGFGRYLKDFVKIRANGKVFGNLLCGAKELVDFRLCPQLQPKACL